MNRPLNRSVEPPVGPTVEPTAPPAHSTERSYRSHGRTDGRTDVEVGTGHLSSADRSAGENYAQFAISNICESLIDDLELVVFDPRHPRIRTGQRDPISPIVRSAVYYRDGGTCQLCGLYRPKPSELDHIIPWSAGGSDASHNLRLTCQPCNQDRSNYHEPTEGRIRTPVTWWCVYCCPDDREWWWHGNDDSGLACGVRWCRVHRVGQQLTGKYDSSWYTLATLIARDLATVFVYCAHCDTHGYTEARCVL